MTPDDEHTRDDVINEAFEELVRDDLRSFHLVTVHDNLPVEAHTTYSMDTSRITHTWLNGASGDPETVRMSDLQTALGYLLADLSRTLDIPIADVAVMGIMAAERIDDIEMLEGGQRTLSDIKE